MDSKINFLIPAGFIALTFGFFGLLFYEIRKALAKTSFDAIKQKKVLLLLIGITVAWLAFVSLWSGSGRMGDFSMFPLNMLPILLLPLLGILIFTFSKTGSAIIDQIPQQNIIRLQSFRIFVEVLLWMLFLQRLAPVQMTFEGRNFDVLTGLTAPVVAFLVSRQKFSSTGIVIWNVLGLALLINILGIAILSMPTPLRVFMNEPVNRIVTVFPISWLPGLLVPLAYGLHFFSLRKLTLPKS